MREMRIVKGASSGLPILLLPEGYVYLSGREFRDEQFVRNIADMRANAPYTKPLTDEEEALAMKMILLHG